MNYANIYYNLIERAKHRNLSEYTEKHHIIPKCLGGANNSDNLVKLTPEEHYLAHQLLVKMYPDNAKLIFAATMMQMNRPSNKGYGWLKRRHSDAMKNQTCGDKNSNFGKMWISDPITGKSKTISKNSIIPEGFVIGRNKKFKPCVICENKFVGTPNTCSRECAKAYKSHVRKESWKGRTCKLINDKEEKLIMKAGAKKAEKEKIREEKRKNRHRYKEYIISLYELFRAGDYKSLGEFHRMNDISVSKMTLSIYWRKYVLEYKINSKERVRFSSTHLDEK